MNTPTDFRPIPVALCERVKQHAENLAVARTVPDQIEALFLAHCELRDAEDLMPKPEGQAVQRTRQAVKGQP